MSSTLPWAFLKKEERAGGRFLTNLGICLNERDICPCALYECKRVHLLTNLVDWYERNICCSESCAISKLVACFRVSASRFRVQGSPVESGGFRVSSLGFRVQGSEFPVRVKGLEFPVQGLGFRVQGSGFRVQGSVFRVAG